MMLLQQVILINTIKIYYAKSLEKNKLAKYSCRL